MTSVYGTFFTGRPFKNKTVLHGKFGGGAVIRE